MIVSARHLPGLHIGEYAPEDVTSVNEAAEVDPRSVGLEADAARVIWKSVERLYRGGLHPAIALTVRRRGEVIVDRAIGHLRGNAPHDPADAPKVPIRHDSLFNLFSGSKAVTAMLVHLLAERGAISLADTVAAYVPEFARHGKGAVTIAQVLTHRAGIPAVPGVAINLDLITDWPRVIETICDAKLTRTPGHLPAYHALTGGFLLGEIVRRVSGLDVRAFLLRELGAPLGFRTFSYGVPKERTREVAHNAYTGIRPLPFASWVLARSLGVGIEEAVDVSNDPRFLTCIVPSGNVIGTADEGSRFFQLLLDGGVQGGIRIFRHETIAAAVRGIHPFGIDAFIGLPVRYGMGFMVGGHVISPYGHATRNAFGHLGFSNVLAWADPDRDISVCLLTSGKPFLTPGQVPWLWVPRAIARVCARRLAAPETPPREGQSRARLPLVAPQIASFAAQIATLRTTILRLLRHCARACRMNSLHSELQALTAEYTAHIVAVVQKAISAAVSASIHSEDDRPAKTARRSAPKQAPVSVKAAKAPAAKPAKAMKPMKAGKRSKGAKRAPEEIAETTSALQAYVKAHAGQRIEQIAKAMKVTTKDLALPAKKLLGDRKLKTKGQKRATQYFPALPSAQSTRPSRSAPSPRPVFRRGDLILSPRSV